MNPMMKRSDISSPGPPMLTSPTHTDFLSDEDVQSFFSVDWGEERRDGRTSLCEYPSVADHSKDETQLLVSIINCTTNPMFPICSQCSSQHRNFSGGFSTATIGSVDTCCGFTCESFI